MPHLEPGNSLGFLITDVSRLFRQMLEKAVLEAGLELTPGEIRVLSHVIRYQGSRQAVLAERMGVEPMTLSAYLDRLEVRGLIKRTTDPSDRRAKVIHNTEKAEKVLADARPISLDVYERATHGLSEAERGEVERLLQRIRMNMANDPLAAEEPRTTASKRALAI
ncbi:DNA-binding transcriptional regulator, MarR family [Fulvimarina manganoxydans]|uniref:DNA-binding transcriptional regulator, MarR family n=1 Tax=Fulvimarina manganoxydans TaxID=937218 RepID=A0A1W2AVC1_9HYPH|nr:MarR family winged helix-turn-helix transcriptional regulator [Fulvimarina manganoxydans]SMC64564.1 DNA-binding transcriptional regulator, MarR family [Fulvimarina manganoxydans]